MIMRLSALGESKNKIGLIGITVSFFLVLMVLVYRLHPQKSRNEKGHGMSGVVPSKQQF
jgi:hypothetical protein